METTTTTTTTMRTFSNLVGKPDRRYIVSDSESPVYGDKYLKVRTSKHNGMTITRASCFAKSADSSFETHMLYADYSVAVARSDKPCTVKNMEAQHEEALRLIDRIAVAAQAHYQGERA